MRQVALITTVIILTTINNAWAQTDSENALIGVWIVVKVHNTMTEIPKEMKPALEAVERALSESKFLFQPNNNFSFDIPMEDMKMKNVHWKIDKESNSILIQEWKDKDKSKPLLLFIKFGIRDNKPVFILDESPFVLEVKKG